AGLSFLGLGVQAPSYDWGKLLYDGLNGIYVHPVAALAPGIAVILAGLAFNLFGEAMARALGVPELAAGAIVRAARAGRGAPRPVAGAPRRHHRRPGPAARPRPAAGTCRGDDPAEHHPYPPGGARCNGAGPGEGERIGHAAPWG